MQPLYSTTRADLRAKSAQRGACRLVVLALAIGALLHAIGFTVASQAQADTGRAADDGAGPQLTSIEITGNRRTRDFIIERELRCSVGDPARQLDVEQMTTRLQNIELFSSIDVSIDSVSTPGEAQLLVDVRERPAILPYPIASNSTKTGVTVGAGVYHANFRGRDERLSFAASGGGVQGVTAGFSNPWVALNHLSVGVSGGWWHEKNRYEDFVEKTWSIGASFGLWLSENERWKARSAVSYVSLKSDEEDKTIDPGNHDQLHAIGLGLAYDSRRLFRNPRRAWLISTAIDWTGGALGGTVHYTQYLVDVRRYQPVPIGHTLALQARLIRRAGTVPGYRLVRLGGSSSIRGYDGGDFEGEHGAIASVEYRFDLMDSRSYDIGPIKNFDVGLAGGVFADAGMAWDRDETVRWENVPASVGGGVRIFMPFVEVMRIDLAYTRSGHVEIEVGNGMKF